MKRGLKISLAAVLLLAAAAGVVWYSKPSSPEPTVATSGEPAGEPAVSAPIKTPLPEDAVIDRLVVHKSKRTMSAYSKGKLLKTYPIALGKQPPLGINTLKATAKRPKGNTASTIAIPTAHTIKTSAFLTPTRPTKPTRRHKAKARAG